MKKAALLLAIIAILAIAGYLIFAGPVQNATEEVSAKVSSALVPQPGALGSGTAEIERTEAIGADYVAGSAAARGGGAAQSEREPVAWFRGQLRTVSGELPVAPILIAVVEPGASSDSEEREVRLDPRELSFAVPAHSLEANCRLRFTDLVKPVRVFGPAALSETDLIFAAPAEGVIVEVEVRPHAGVRFLHDPSGEPLAGAAAWHRVEDATSSSATYSIHLDSDGMMFFDFERLADVGGAEKIIFSVSRPPDIGYSESPAYPVKEFLNMPRPVELRFGATERLRFRVVDAARNPIPGASVRVGNGLSAEVADAEGWIGALQSVPPEENVVAQAPGYITATLPITPAAQTGQELELQPASRIVLVGTEAPPGGWGQLDVELIYTGRADSTTLLPRNFIPGRFAECSGGTGITSHTEELRFILGSSFSQQGRLVVDGIHVDVPVQVLVMYRGFAVFEQRIPLQPGDGEHLVQIGTLPQLIPLTGLVEDSTGAPLAGAAVKATNGSWEHETRSGADGRFDLGMAAAGSTTRVRLALAGYAIQQVEHVADARDEDSLGRIRMTGGRRVVLRILAPDGTPFVAQPGTVGAAAWPELEVFGARAYPVDGSSHQLGAGEWLFTDLPAGTFHCLIQSDWVELDGSLELGTAQPIATLTISSKDFEKLNSKL